MALDSKQKRMAVPGVGRPWLRSNYSDTAKDGPWRASVGNVYPVTTFAALPTIVVSKPGVSSATQKLSIWSATVIRNIASAGTH